jgi:hypothetical protein
MQGESTATAGYHSANAAVTHTEDQIAEATIGALSNLATATSADRGVVAALTQANARLAKHIKLLPLPQTTDARPQGRTDKSKRQESHPTKERARARLRYCKTEPNYYYCPITLVMS